MKKMKFPNGKKFAFTIFDDTDHATIQNVKPIYDVLSELGILTTKSVWVYPGKNIKNLYYNSQTLSDTDYLNFIKKLHDQGFEIAFHNASMETSERDDTIAALHKFKELLGFYPNIHTNHTSNMENLYWGPERLDIPLLKWLMHFKRKKSKFNGHNPESPFFWGDICYKYISYVRNFNFREINLLRINPTLPYRDPKRPFVKYWFSSSEGANVRLFNELLCAKNQEKLEQENGVCIVYTHFANDFVRNGQVDSQTKTLLIELSKRKGWFVPVSTLLDYLRDNNSHEVRSLTESIRMEVRWAFSKLLHGTS